MAEPTGDLPQVNDPELEAELIRILSVVGPLGKLNVADLVIPVVNIADAFTREVLVRQPSFRSTDVFSAGIQTGAAVTTVHADTGQLPVGVYDILVSITLATSAQRQWGIQHRNAANSANLMELPVVSDADGPSFQTQTFGYVFGPDERLRVINGNAMGAGELSTAFIFARVRS